MGSSWSLAQKTSPEPFGTIHFPFFKTAAFLGFCDKESGNLSCYHCLLVSSHLSDLPFQPLLWAHLPLLTTICPGNRKQGSTAGSLCSCLYSDLWHKVTLGWQLRPRTQCLSQGILTRWRLGHRPSWLLRTLFQGRAEWKQGRKYHADWKAQHSARKQTWSLPLHDMSVHNIQRHDSQKTIRKHYKKPAKKTTFQVVGNRL